LIKSITIRLSTVSDGDSSNDEMSITRADLYADIVQQRSHTRPCVDDMRSFQSQRPSRVTRRPAKYDETQYTQSQHVRRVKCGIPSNNCFDRHFHDVNTCPTPTAYSKEVNSKTCVSSESSEYCDWSRKQECQELAAASWYKSSARSHICHCRVSGETVQIGLSYNPDTIIIDKASHSSKLSSIVHTDSSISVGSLDKRGNTPPISIHTRYNAVMARTKQSDRKVAGQRQDGVTPAVHGYPCPRCDKVFTRRCNITCHTVRRH